jgi:hypothetical protein
MDKERMKYSTNMVEFLLAIKHILLKTGYVVSSALLISLMIPSKIQAGMAPASWNGLCVVKVGDTGSWKESKRDLLEESIVQME